LKVPPPRADWLASLFHILGAGFHRAPGQTGLPRETEGELPRWGSRSHEGLGESCPDSSFIKPPILASVGVLTSTGRRGTDLTRAQTLEITLSARVVSVNGKGRQTDMQWWWFGNGGVG